MLGRKQCQVFKCFTYILICLPLKVQQEKYFLDSEASFPHPSYSHSEAPVKTSLSAYNFNSSFTTAWRNKMQTNLRLYEINASFHTVDQHRHIQMFTESSWVSPRQQQADSVFHQLDQTQHHLWYSSWHWSRHPNAHNNTATATHCICKLIYHMLV